MTSIPIYSETGEQLGAEQLDEALLGGEVNAKLLKQAIVRYHANLRQGTVAQKTRAEVVGSTRKLYRQKGTGRARMGNARTPVRRGGGRAFPRKPHDFRQRMPKKMRRLARNNAVLAKMQSEAVCIVDHAEFDAPKTKRFAAMLSALQVHRGCVFATAAPDPVVYKSGRNIPRIEIMSVADLNAFAILQRQKLVFTKSAFEQFKAGLTGSAQVSGDAASDAGASAAAETSPAE